MKIKDWNIEEITGYKPITTFYSDFSIAEKFGKEVIKETYSKAFEEWNQDYKYITELVMVLNWKIFEHYENNDELARLYNDMWEELDNWCLENLKGSELSYFIKVTD
jgi:hypothetical protein